MTMNDPNGPDIGHRPVIDRSSDGTIWVLAVVFAAVFVGMIAVYAMMEDRTSGGRSSRCHDRPEPAGTDPARQSGTTSAVTSELWRGLAFACRATRRSFSKTCPTVPVRGEARRYSTLPGLRMPLGSSVRLRVRISS